MEYRDAINAFIRATEHYAGYQSDSDVPELVTSYGRLVDRLKADRSANDTSEDFQDDFSNIGYHLQQLYSRHYEQLSQAIKPFGDLAREEEWRLPLGRSGIFQSCLEMVKHTAEIEEGMVVEQAFRLLGNCVADNDEARDHFLRLDGMKQGFMRHLTGPKFHMFLSVIYNVCLDYEPAQTAFALNDGLHLIVESCLANSRHDVLGCELIGMAASSTECKCTLPDFLMILWKCGNMLSSQESFLPLANALLSLFPRFPLILKDEVHLDAYASTVQRAHDFVTDAQEGDLREDLEASRHLFFSLLARIYEITATDTFRDGKQPETVCRKGSNYNGSSCEIQTMEEGKRPDFITKLCQMISSNDRTQTLLRKAVYLITVGNMARSDAFAITLGQQSLGEFILDTFLRPSTTLGTTVKAGIYSDSIIVPGYVASIVQHAALHVLGQIAIPAVNKSALVDHNAFPKLLEILDDDQAFTEDIHIGAITVIRRLTAGSMDAISSLNRAVLEANSAPTKGKAKRDELECASFASDVQHEGSSRSTGPIVSSGTQDLLQVYKKSDKTSLKLEIGRFVAEICRTIGPLGADGGSASPRARKTLESIGGLGDLAKPLGFVVLNAQSLGAKTEGWFAMGIMSSWKEGRSAIIKCLDNEPSLVEAMDQVCQEKQRADVDNVRVVLTNLAADLETIPVNLLHSLQKAAELAGLDTIRFIPA